VLDDYIHELARIGRLPQRVMLQRNIGGTDFDVTVIIDPLKENPTTEVVVKSART
jgi:hypothetical protein